jgi:hypothetical protein
MAIPHRLSHRRLCEVAFWHLADLDELLINVRFRGSSRHHNTRAQCPLMTQGGHKRVKIAAAQSEP